MTDGTAHPNRSAGTSAAVRPVLSIVLPAYNESGNIREMYQRLAAALEPLHVPWEIIVADDGSRDETWNEIMALHASDARVKGIQLARNFGHQYALFAGLGCACGDAVVSMDADLQHPPELIQVLVERWQAGYKIVNTARRDPASLSRFKQSTSALFYSLLSKLSGVPMRRGMSDFRLLDRQVVDDLLAFGEAGLFLRGLVMWIGYPIAWVPFDSGERMRGNTKYTLRKMVLFALDGVTSFSVIPLRLGILIGMLTSLLAFGELAYALVMKISGGRTVPGWASAVSVVSFLFGVMFILLGLIGEYIGRILIEVRRRPRYVIDASVGLDTTRTGSREDPKRDHSSPSHGRDADRGPPIARAPR